ncbi:DUF1622 domain-containing protein [Stenotrophomonas sp. TWI273]|jgi:uncharacterized membrane protein|uniref:Putative membrane protein n=1 Tax=Stenotrophomonas rhizophila TaxID=216778 RepID=A0A498CDW8_9GAMM|nr:MULTISPECIES: DUF1622 domain-containing protein [Stenotrophomonas]RLK56099.1 putative membrane protein [Stenotrophomonas rhizophila]HAU80288.1 hypothetical protein [Stenotrophomonas sp.]
MLPLKAWLIAITEPVVVIIDAMALVLIAMATVVVFVRAVRLALRGHLTNVERRDLWLGYGRWLVAGLTMQLSADIIESSIYTSWDAIGQLAAIAVIRTFLNYFLERDIADVRERQRATRPAPEPEPL